MVLITIRDLLKKDSKNQALIMSGESGAGKTVAARNAMECITHYFEKLNKLNYNNNNHISNSNIPLEQQIFNCNPILEAF